MHKNGINFWAISTGNEPAISEKNYLFPEMNWNMSNHARWIADYFGPTIRSSKFSDIEIFGFDDTRSNVNDWLNDMHKGNPDAFDFLSAFQFHGYADSANDPVILDEIQKKYSVDIWYTEMCFGIKFLNKTFGGPQLGMWSRSEDLIKVLFENLAHSTNG